MISSKEYDFKTLKDYAIGYINLSEKTGQYLRSYLLTPIFSILKVDVTDGIYRSS